MPALTRAELRELDRIAIEEYAIPGVVLMENAGRGAAEIIAASAASRHARRVAIACGPGNNGGDGCVVARHLANSGLDVVLFATEPASALRGDAAVMRAIVDRMGLAVHDVGSAEGLSSAGDDLAACDLLVDALLGTGFAGERVRPTIARVIERMNALRSARDPGRELPRIAIALDVPSGLDADRGMPASPTFAADVTITFAAPKVGFARSEAASVLGRVVVVPIGAPAGLARRLCAERRAARSP